MAKIDPTVGRVVWFHPSRNDRIVAPGGFPIPLGEQPLAATIAYVHKTGQINIGYLDASGVHHRKEGVRLLQDGEERPVNESFCEWMPYQKGQAAKHDAAANTPAVGFVGDKATQIARICHEVNRAYCASQGDHSQPSWVDAPLWQCTSAVKGVAFALANPDAKPSDSHESWLAEKRAEGWVYGAVKDPAAKQHPCFVPYDELPPAQKAKDYIFLGVVRALQ